MTSRHPKLTAAITTIALIAPAVGAPAASAHCRPGSSRFGSQHAQHRATPDRGRASFHRDRRASRGV